MDSFRSEISPPGRAPAANRVNVLVAGGGVAALEAVLALRALAGDRVRIRVLTPDALFAYRPLRVLEPFDRGAMFTIPWSAVAADCGCELVPGRLVSVDAAAGTALTATGTTLTYDELVIATGAIQTPAVAGAIMLGAREEAPRLAELVATMRRSLLHRVVVAIPAGVTWTVPAYELALQIAQLRAANGATIHIHVVTAEREPAGVLGADASLLVERLLAERWIRLDTGCVADKFLDGRLWIDLVGGVQADAVIALPFLVGPCIGGLDATAGGFLPVDEYCRMKGAAHVYVVGDAADHPVKQGGLAAQQADVAAASIAAGAGAEVEPAPYQPVLRAMLLDGDSHYNVRVPLGAPPRQPVITTDLIWWPPAKIAGRYLGPYLAQAA
jgi:sulfide:quinone oxidoreductase